MDARSASMEDASSFEVLPLAAAVGAELTAEEAESTGDGTVG
jgi:hypothetical protein